MYRKDRKVMKNVTGNSHCSLCLGIFTLVLCFTQRLFDYNNSACTGVIPGRLFLSPPLIATDFFKIFYMSSQLHLCCGYLLFLPLPFTHICKTSFSLRE